MSTRDLETFESLRRDLFALAYRMLGDVGRAQDMVQEAWLRWHHRDATTVVDNPKGFLVTVVTRLCLNELSSARARREQGRPDRLPDPVDLNEVGLGRLEALEQVSMAFLVLLERLTPAERAVLLLHDVFDFTHEEIATLIARSPAACRKLLERAHAHIEAGRRMVTASREEHERLLAGFVHAAAAGDAAALVGLLADDAILVTDGGPSGRAVGRFRNLRKPLAGAAHIAGFVAATSRAAGFEMQRRELNGQPGVVLLRDGAPSAVILLGVADGKIQRVFFHANRERLRWVGGASRHKT